MRPLLVAGTALLLAACAPAAADPEVDRPAPDDTYVAELVTGINKTGVAMYLAAREDGKNTALSPVSIGLAFGMADAGAVGGLEQAISGFFEFPAQGEQRLGAFNALDQALTDDTDGKVVQIANRLFTDSNFEPLEDYRVALATYFGAGAEAVPMASDGDKAAKRINGWISDRTNGLIKDLVKPQTFNDQSRVMLANTLYMKADWNEPFEAEDTWDQPFTLLDGSTVTAELMHQSTWGEATRGDGWVAGTKPYLEGDKEMLILVPDEGRFAEIEDNLAQVIGDFDATSTETEYTLVLPKFTAESTTNLREVMEDKLGAAGIFDVMELDGIGPQLYISSAAHGVKIIVDEEGTEAAAATVIGVEAGSAPMEPEIEVIADQPFIYVIRDVDTGAILFVGRVLDPSI
mgnify:FL=1